MVIVVKEKRRSEEELEKWQIESAEGVAAQQLILLMPARSDNRLLFISERNGKGYGSPKSCCACDIM